jgi:hypothetical protein
MSVKPDAEEYDRVADRVIRKHDHVWEWNTLCEDAPISRAMFAVGWERLTPGERNVFNCLVDAGRTTSLASLASVYDCESESLSSGVLDRLVATGLVRKRSLLLAANWWIEWYEPSEVEPRYDAESKPAESPTDSVVMVMGDCLFAAI